MGFLNEALAAEVSGVAETSAEFEINGEVYTIVARPLTPLDMQAVTKAHRDFATNPNMEGMVDLIIRKARLADTDDKPVFDKADKPFLMRMKTSKIGELFAALFNDQLTTDSDEAIEIKKGN